MFYYKFKIFCKRFLKIYKYFLIRDSNIFTSNNKKKKSFYFLYVIFLKPENRISKLQKPNFEFGKNFHYDCLNFSNDLLHNKSHCSDTSFEWSSLTMKFRISVWKK